MILVYFDIFWCRSCYSWVLQTWTQRSSPIRRSSGSSFPCRFRWCAALVDLSPGWTEKRRLCWPLEVGTTSFVKVISGTWWTKWWRKCTMQNSSSLWSFANRNREEAHGETVLTFRPLQSREFRFVLSGAKYRDFNPLHLQVPGYTTAWGVARASLFSNNEQPNKWKKTYIDPVQHAEVWWS